MPTFSPSARVTSRMPFWAGSSIKRGYTYGEGLASGDLTARLRQLKEELAVLTRQSALATVRVSAYTWVVR